MVILKNTLIFKGFKVGTTFSRWGAQTIPGWVQMLISIETNITCDFLGGSGPSIPPLDPRMAYHMRIQSSVSGVQAKRFLITYSYRGERGWCTNWNCLGQFREIPWNQNTDVHRGSTLITWVIT